MTLVEKYYGKTFRTFLAIINPFKKLVHTTEAKVHQYINIKSLDILKAHGYKEEYEFMKMYSIQFNKGVVWADKDFKSVGHFYNPIKKRGLYGHTNALILSQKYYNKALEYWEKGDKHKSIFYLGASIHIIQDLTVPQHVNIRLLDSHSQYESFVKINYELVKEFTSSEKPIQLEKLEHYIRFNAKIALRIYKQFKHIKNDKERFHKTTLCSLPLAQRTSAGCILTFLNEVEFMDN